MVKFSKELEAQLIPEWKDAFVNYWQLKKHVKKIKLCRKKRQPPSDLKHDFGRSILDPICFMAMKVRSKSIEDNGSDEEEILYQTQLGQLFSEEDEVRVFFERLDEELNKVNQFYKTKESEFVERGEILSKQLEILLELKRIVSDSRRRKPNAGVLQRSCSSSLPESGFSGPNVKITQKLSQYMVRPSHGLDCCPCEKMNGNAWKL